MRQGMYSSIIAVTPLHYRVGILFSSISISLVAVLSFYIQYIIMMVQKYPFKLLLVSLELSVNIYCAWISMPLIH